MRNKLICFMCSFQGCKYKILIKNDIKPICEYCKQLIYNDGARFKEVKNLKELKKEV